MNPNGQREEWKLSESDQKIVDDLISRLGPEELWKISDMLRKAAMDDIDSSMRQVEEDNRKELAWVRR